MDRPCLGEVYDSSDLTIEQIEGIINEKEQSLEETFFKILQKIMVETWNKMSTLLHVLTFALSLKYNTRQSILHDTNTRVALYSDPKVAQRYMAAIC